MISNKLEMSMLCDIYGSLLTDKQRDALEMYCNEDYSLSEIAEHTGISRQGVRDQIKHAENELVMYEKILGLREKYSNMAALLMKLAKAPEIKQNKELSQIVSEIQNQLNLD